MNRLCLATAAAALLAAGMRGQTAAPAHLRAGSHKVDFTPRESELALSTDSIHDCAEEKIVSAALGLTCRSRQ
jgi:hypothetical protein